MPDKEAPVDSITDNFVILPHEPKGKKYKQSYNQVARLRDLYKLSIDDFNLMLETQNYSCKVCIRPFGENTPQVDHDHLCCPGSKSCGKCIRGLLCGGCNRALAHAKDSVTTLKQLINYLEEYRQSYYNEAL